MSQNQGGLTEDELREYINDKYSLRLERDAFLRPNKDVIVDIYQKFLDEFRPRWRQEVVRRGREDSYTPPIKVLMVKYLRLVIKNYNNSYTFNLTDLITPNRQRTRLTLNILIYHRERIQEVLSKFQEESEELMMEQEELECKRQELAQKKEEIEELAIAISKSKTADEHKLSIIEKTKILDALKEECEEIGNRAKRVKSESLSKREEVKRKEALAEEQLRDIQRLEGILQSLNDGLNIKDKIADTENTISVVEADLRRTQAKVMEIKKREGELQRLISVQHLFDSEALRCQELSINNITTLEKESSARHAAIESNKSKLSELTKQEETLKDKLEASTLRLKEIDISVQTQNERFKLEYATRQDEIENRIKALSKEDAELRSEKDDLKRARTEIKLKYDEKREEHKRYSEKADKRFKALEELYLNSRAQDDRDSAIITERKFKIYALVGRVEPEVTILDMPANRTYIKDKTDNNGINN